MLTVNASILLGAFNHAAREGKKPKLPGEIATNEARIKIGKLWEASPILCYKRKIKTGCRNILSGEREIRKIPITMLSADKESPNEEIALIFNHAGQISDLNITIKSEIIKDAGEWELSQEEGINYNKIIDFLEKFRTAYACKDIEYIKNIYSIGIHNFYDNQVKRKKQYLTDLKKAFNKKAYVNVVFDFVEIEPHPGKYSIYGVTVKQRWKSSTFSDVGFLYLLIDCRKGYEMQIFVRAWSPDRIFDFAFFDEIRN
ncbi:hypothetical protein AGMMS50239_15710 [Bacteroidia bacterium]|nr:hypothetical protein AGMMS50239_15710 [Bacteroidia bacterium]